MLACPYQVPRYQWTKLAPFVKKCDLCSERIKAGKSTACAEACPVQATIFGNRDELDRRSLEPHSRRLVVRAADLRAGRTRRRQRAVRLRRSLREAGIQAGAHRQSAHANAHRQRAGRLAQSCHHGRHHSLGACTGSRSGAAKLRWPKPKRKPPSTGSKGKGASHDCANQIGNYFMARHCSHHICYRPLCDVYPLLRGIPRQHQPERPDALGPVGRPGNAVRHRTLGRRLRHQRRGLPAGHGALPAHPARLDSDFVPRLHDRHASATCTRSVCRGASGIPS